MNDDTSPHGDQHETPSRTMARVTTTVSLPPDALTVVAPSPEMISQINVEQVLGIPSRIYLELLREPGCSVTVTAVGKLRLVDRYVFRKWLEARGKTKRVTGAATASNAAPPAEDDDMLTVEEQVRLGIKPAPKAAAGQP
jgi:hypothetical protein